MGREVQRFVMTLHFFTDKKIKVKKNKNVALMHKKKEKESCAGEH